MASTNPTPSYDHDKFRSLIHGLYKTVEDLEAMFPGRHFTPDGHMVGSIGECLVADHFNLTLMTSSNEGFDAKTASGIEVEIKATQSKSVSFRSCPKHAIVVHIRKDGSFEICYNGPGAKIWSEFSGKEKPSNGQHQIRLTRIREINKGILDNERIHPE